jgi:hypothetical protein
VSAAVVHAQTKQSLHVYMHVHAMRGGRGEEEGRKVAMEDGEKEVSSH